MKHNYSYILCIYQDEESDWDSTRHSETDKGSQSIKIREEVEVITAILYTVKPCYNGHSKLRPPSVLSTKMHFSTVNGSH